MSEPTPELIDAPEAAGVPFMLVGAYACNAHGVTRSTRDAGFVVPIGPDQQRFRRRRVVRQWDRDVYSSSAEDVLIAKLRWAQCARRPKDTDDARMRPAIQGDSLDWSYVHHRYDQHGTRELLDALCRSLPEV